MIKLNNHSVSKHMDKKNNNIFATLKELAQSVAMRVCNPRVSGSIPGVAVCDFSGCPWARHLYSASSVGWGRKMAV
jgi:hypothetical protein